MQADRPINEQITTMMKMTTMMMTKTTTAMAMVIMKTTTGGRKQQLTKIGSEKNSGSCSCGGEGGNVGSDNVEGDEGNDFAASMVTALQRR